MRTQARRGWRLIRGAALLMAFGCAEQSDRFDAAKLATTETAPAGVTTPAASTAKAPGGAADVPPNIPRKVIYNAQLTLVVDSVSAVGQEVARLVKDAGGYVSGTDLTSYSLSHRRATWTVRVPVERFDGFVAAVGRLGELQQNHVDSQDVTQEFYDTEARITNKQQEEKRLLKHLADSTGKLEDILAVERELSRVRGEIELMQGRIRFLANQSSMSTVTITATETRDYTPPVRPTFATRLGRTFRASLDNLVGFGEWVTLTAVAVAPWLPVLFVAALPLVWWRRKLRAERRARAA